MKAESYKPGESYEYPLIIKKILATGVIYGQNQEIVYRDKFRYKYQDMYERVHRLANGLESLGVGEGDVVAILDFDSHRYLECFFAIPMMGATMHTLNYRLSPAQLIYTINHAEDSVILVNQDFLPLLEAIRRHLKTVKKIILLTDTGKKPETKVEIDMEYEEMLKGVSASYDFPDLDENTRATIFYTTGTTGDPKGVHFTHRQLVLHTLVVGLNVGSYEMIGRFRSDDVYMPLTPMFHVHAWGLPYLATMLGVKQVYPGRYEPEVLLKLILGEKVTFSHCIPTIMHMIVTNPVAKKVDLSKWKVVIGGAALPRALAKASMDLGIQIYSAYGMSETCPLITGAGLKSFMRTLDEEKKLDIYIKTGLPAPLVEVQIVDPDGKTLPNDGRTTGELVMRAPWLTQTYYKDPDKSKDLWRDGWLHSGDVAYIDEHGYVQITDRLKDVIKTGGEWVSSIDIENMATMHPAVSEAAVIGVPDPKWGERPLVVLVLKAEFKGKVTSEDVKEYLKKMSDEGKLPKYGIPDRYEFVDAIPRTSVGKINKVELRKIYAK
ncbi:MAG: fatty acid--CoA ligase [Syntrophales bacterium]|jgi:fatty-acyl-CoA synthase